MHSRIIMVTGMHRSGTSLVAQALESLGVSFGDDIKTGNQWNEKGYYEYRPAIDASLTILRRLDRRPFTPGGLKVLPQGWIEQPWVKKIEDNLVIRLEKDLENETVRNSNAFGLKDPHSTLLMPLWENVFKRLGMKYDLVMAIRHPADVARSIFRRDRREFIDSERMWHLYNLYALSLGGDRIKSVIDYSSWLEKGAQNMDELSRRFNLPQPDSDFKLPYRQELDHGQGDKDILLDQVKDLYNRISSTGPSEEDWQLLCCESEKQVRTLELFQDTGAKQCRHLKDEDKQRQVAVNREMLARRRRRILFPKTDEDMAWMWPPDKTVPFDKDQDKNVKVAVVLILPPTPDQYSIVGRYTAELISVLIRNNVRPVLLNLGLTKQDTFLIKKAVNDNWDGASVEYQEVGAPKVPAVRGPLGKRANWAYCLYEWLKDMHFDVIHAPDFRGSLYYCMRTKEQGLRFGSTRFVVHPVGGIYQNFMNEYKSIDSLAQLARIYLERSCLELADTVPITGKVMFRKLLDFGVSFSPEQIEHTPVPFDDSFLAGYFKEKWPGKSHGPLKRVICFTGSSRRGIALFCKAVQRGYRKTTLPFSVTFVVSNYRATEIESYIQSLTASISNHVNVRIIGDREALKDLLNEESDILCVFPVVVEANYFQMRDLAALGVPMLVADHEAANEVIEASTCAQLPDAIFKKIEKFIKTRTVLKGMANEIWVPASWVSAGTPVVRSDFKGEWPLVTVCLMHFERPDLLEQALASVEAQTYPVYEVVLLDDGSLKKRTLDKLDELEKQFAPKGWQVIRQQNRYLGAARNSAAMAGHGKYLYFLDDDNILKPHALETFVKVAEHTKADVVAALSDAFEGKNLPEPNAIASRRIIQVGDDLSYGFFRNSFGDSNALIRRDSFFELGGNSEDYAVGLDDMEFFARSVLNGYRLTTVPEALYWARQMPTRLRNLHFNPNAGRVRVCRAYLPHVPSKLGPMLLYASGTINSGFEENSSSPFWNLLKAYLLNKVRPFIHSPQGTRIRYGIVGQTLRKLRRIFDRG